MDVYIGFDSAWMNNPKAPGAIACLAIEGGRAAHSRGPDLVSFAGALSFIREHASTDGPTLIAIDQPTLVPNATGKRLVERVVSSLIGWLGGGVQPSSRSRIGMFCDAAAIWGFLQELAGREDPEAARSATHGLHSFEVFPALALASMSPAFFGRLSGPRYNPARRATFRLPDWQAVTRMASDAFRRLGSAELTHWCDEAALRQRPKKADQDKLDALLCLLIAVHWRTMQRDKSILLGDLQTGYMVSPVTMEVRERLVARALLLGVPVDDSA